MLPAVAIVGRPNVGKSTLFNFLTASRDALVADLAGLTRDRQYGFSSYGSRRCIVVDTGGLAGPEDALARLTSEQAEVAIAQAQVVVLMVDAREGLNAADQEVAERLRRSGKPVVIAVNKTDTLDPLAAVAEFHVLGLGQPHPVAAASGRGIRALWEAVSAHFGEAGSQPARETAASLQVAVVGRPNVGKSTFINAVLGEERMIAHDAPGTTRDSVRIVTVWRGRTYTLIDTAGIRRRPRVRAAVEKFSIIKTLQAIDQANICVVLVDAIEGVTEQDARLLGQVLEAGKGLVLTVNKWDAVARSERNAMRRRVERRTAFLDFADVHYISAARGRGLTPVFESVDRAWAAARRDLSTPELTRVLAGAVREHPPPVVRRRRIKLKYAHQGGTNPPVIVIHGNQTDALPEAYRRYLTRVFRKAFDLRGTPLRIELRTASSPYAERRNVLTGRQRRRRQRLFRR